MSPPPHQPPPQQPHTPPPPPQPQHPHPQPQHQPPQHPHPQPQHQPPQHPHQHPQPQYYPYPYPHPHHHHRKRSSKTFASCILATTFLIILAIAAAITFFILFRPMDPSISITAMKFPTYTLVRTNSTANFTFLQFASVRNPNRFAFSHHGSSIQLVSSSAGPIGFIYIPAGQIPGGSTKYLSATFDVRAFPVSGGPGPTMELETRMVLVGSVKVLQVFAHHVEKRVRCRVSVQASDGSLLGYHC